MVNRNLLRQYDLTEEQLSHELDDAFQEDNWLPPESQDFGENRLLTGRVLQVTADSVWIPAPPPDLDGHSGIMGGGI